MPSILKNSTITFLSQFLIFVFSFVASIILARVLGPEGRGIYALIVLIPLVMHKMGSLGIEAANVYFTGSKKYKVKDIISNSLLLGILIGVILIMLFFLISQLDIVKNYLTSTKINPLYLWIAIISVPFLLLSGYLMSIFLGEEKITLYNKVNILRSIFQLILLLVFLLILEKGIFGAVMSYVVGIISITLFIIILTIKSNEISYSINRSQISDSIKFGLRAYFGNLTQFLNYRLDMILVAVFLAPASVGIYSIAVGIAERLWMLPGAIATVLFPRITSLDNKEANNITPKIARHTFLITSTLALLLAFIARPAITILFGSIFLPSVKPLIILLPGVIALGSSKILTADLAGRGKPQFGTYSSFVSLAVNIPLNLWLIPKWGISGAAFASSIAYITSTIVVIMAFTKISNTSWVKILFIRKSDIQDYINILAKIRKL